jgi:hypothetical protein
VFGRKIESTSKRKTNVLDVKGKRFNEHARFFKCLKIGLEKCTEQGSIGSEWDRQ